MLKEDSVARGIYTVFALSLIGLTFILPIVFYRFPIIVNVVMPNGAIFRQKLPIFYAYYAMLVAFLWFAFVFFIMIWPSKRAITFSRVWPKKAAFISFFVFSFIGIIASFFTNLFFLPGTIHSAVYQSSLLSLAALIIGIAFLKNGEGTKFQKFALYTVFFINVFSFAILPMFLARIYPLMATSIVLVFGLYYFKAFNIKIICLLMVFFFLLFLIMQPLKTTIRFYLKGPYRKVPIETLFTRYPKEKSPYQIVTTKRGEKISLNILYMKNIHQVLKAKNRKKMFLIILKKEKRLDPNFNQLRFEKIFKKILPLGLYSGVVQMIYRLNHFDELVEVMTKTPSKIPYLYGKTYCPFLYIFIPRIVWPNKPYDSTGQLFGHRYSILWLSDKTTSVNLPILIEGWMNFGLFGVILSAILFGFSLRFIWLYFIGNTGQIGNAVFGALILYSAINCESSLFLVLGGFLHVIIVLWPLDILIRFLSKGG